MHDFIACLSMASFFNLFNNKLLTHDCECVRAGYNTNGI